MAMTSPFVWPARIYWEDTDAGGVVYYANYLKFLERARTEWLRSLGVEQGELHKALGLLFAVVHVEARYRRPARYDDLLQVTCAIVQRSRTTVTFAQEIYRDSVGGELLLSGSVRAACLDATTFRPRPLPDFFLKEMQQ
jgi:acyl-CoA thioester hydrolase